MSRYRIRQVDNRFTPQFKRLCWWVDFEEDNGYYSEPYKFYNLEHAKSWLANELRTQVVTIHPYP